MTRVLILHNAYRMPGGEERAVTDQAALLREHGHAVEVLSRSSAGLGRTRAASAMLRGGVDPGAVTEAVRRHDAEVVHAHNLHPLLGSRALAAARAAGARTVLHLHNFRVFCAIAVAFRDGAPCFRCEGRDTRPGVRLRCRGNAPEAAVYGAALALHQERLLGGVDRFVAPSSAAAARLVALGLPAGRLDILPHFLPATAWAEDSAAAHGTFALFAGRLAEEKGADVAIAAARRAGVPLRVAGEGPDEARLRALAAGADVRFLGRLAPRVLAAERRAAGVVLVPSRWEEPFGYVALEALAAGVPVRTGDRGGLPEVVGAASALPPQDVERWSEALGALMDDPAARRAEGEAAITGARERFGPDTFHRGLLGVYARAGAAGRTLDVPDVLRSRS